MSKHDRSRVITEEVAESARAKADDAYNRQYIDDLRFVATTPQGRRALARLIFDVCGVVYGTGWEANAKIHFDAGKRWVGEDILGKLEVSDPGVVRKMVTDWFGSREDWRLAISQAVQEAKKKAADEGDES